MKVSALFRVVSAAGLLLAVSACASWIPAEEHTFTLADSGLILEARTGDTITITLPGDLSDEENWILMTPLNGKVLFGRRVDIRQQNVPGTEPGKLPAELIFRYSVVGPGDSGIALEYKKPLFRNGPAKRRFNLLVKASGESLDGDNMFEGGKPPEIETMTDSKGRVLVKPKGLLD